MAVAAALVAGRLLGQALTATQPAVGLSAPSILPTPANEPKSGQSKSVVPAQAQPAAPAFPAFPEVPVRSRRATNAAPAAAASTNFPSALPRAFPRPAAPPAPPVPGGASSSAAKPAASGGGGAPATPAGGAAKAGQPSEEDQAINDATLKALRERGGTNEPSDSIVFKDQDLNVFLDQVYGPLVRRTVLRAQGLPQVRISIDTQTTLTEQEEVQMWDTVLALNGITMIPQGEKFVTAVPVAQALQEGARFSNKPSDQYAEASQFVTHVVTLKHVAIEEAVPTITPFAKNANGIVALASTKTLVLRDYAINVKRMLEIIAKIDIEVEEDFQLEVIPIKYGKVSWRRRGWSGRDGRHGGRWHGGSPRWHRRDGWHGHGLQQPVWRCRPVRRWGEPVWRRRPVRHRIPPWSPAGHRRGGPAWRGGGQHGDFPEPIQCHGAWRFGPGLRLWRAFRPAADRQHHRRHPVQFIDRLRQQEGHRQAA